MLNLTQRISFPKDKVIYLNSKRNKNIYIYIEIVIIIKKKKKVKFENFFREMPPVLGWLIIKAK